MPDELRAGRHHEKPLCRPLASSYPCWNDSSRRKTFSTSLENASRALGSRGDECVVRSNEVAMLKTVKAIDLIRFVESSACSVTARLRFNGAGARPSVILTAKKYARR